MSRKRSGAFADRPPNLKVQMKKGTPYFSYQFPDGTTKSLGQDPEIAYTRAKALNEHFVGSVAKQDLSPRTYDVNNPFFPQVIDDYVKERLGLKKLTPKTLEGIRYRLNDYRTAFKNYRVNEFTIRDIALYLNKKKPHSYSKHRTLLIEIFNFASHQGYRENLGNPARETMKALPVERLRERHTPEGIEKILAIAPPWLVRTINLALTSLQRKGDLINLTRDHVNLQNNTLEIFQQKTRNYAKPVYILVDMHPELRSAVEACLSTNIACPYLLHHRFERIKPEHRKTKKHPFQLAESYVSHEFAYWRDQCGAYNHLPSKRRPSFHDLRAYGINELSKRFPATYVQALSGHADERMFNHYRSGHEELKPEFLTWKK